MSEPQFESKAYSMHGPLTLARWHSYGFDEELIAKYRLRDISAAEASELGFHSPSDGIYIEYPQDENSRIRYHRTGFQAQTDCGKYGQRPKTAPALYVPPPLAGCRELSEVSVPVVLLEGEFKAIALDVIANELSTKIIPLAIGGVSSWQSAKLGWDLLPELAQIKWGGRTVYLAFDMDSTDNPNVSLALGKLFNKLSSKGAICKVLTWPLEEGKGLDDYLTSKGLPTEAWVEVVNRAQMPAHILTVLDMNRRFVYVEGEQKVFDTLNQRWVTVKSFGGEFFTEKFKVQTGVKNTPQGVAPTYTTYTNGSYWLQSSLRRAVAGLQFVPGGTQLVEEDAPFSDIKLRYLNTWRGWGIGLSSKVVKPTQGDVSPFYKFIQATFGHEDPRHADYLVRRLAWMFQQPLVKHPTWIYLIGAPMQGKSALIKLISSLVGQAYVSNIDEKAMQSSFSEWRAEKLLITLDDSSVQQRHAVQQLLKRLTTEEASQVEKKYQSQYTAPNYSTFFFAANGTEALIEHDDRRALVLEAMCPWNFAAGEWREFDVWRNSAEGKAALLHHFLYEVKLDSEFYDEKPPHTQARALVIETGFSSWDFFLHMMATLNGPLKWRSPAGDLIREWEPTIFTMDMLRVLFELKSSPGMTEKLAIKNGAMTSKLSRFGFRKAVPVNRTDSRGRLMVGDKQVTLWTNKTYWMNQDKDTYLAEYFKVLREYPELDSVMASKY